jgi:endonuclease-3 related protein
MSENGSSFVQNLYDFLLRTYGPQGWWPVLRESPNGELESFYHVSDDSYPQTPAQRFEICVGSILTQNTAWKQANSALKALYKKNLLTPQALLAESPSRIAELIRPAGYFNVKSRKLAAFSEFYIQCNGKTPSRGELLRVWGVGPETADSMLLYAWGVPSFVIDAYTRRILAHAGVLPPEKSYNNAKEFFEANLPAHVTLFREYHALLVEHGKRHYSRKPYGVCDPFPKTLSIF